MAAAIRDGLGFESKLIPGSGGVFDVRIDDELIYSKHDEENQFPEHAMLMERLTERNA